MLLSAAQTPRVTLSRTTTQCAAPLPLALLCVARVNLAGPVRRYEDMSESLPLQHANQPSKGDRMGWMVPAFMAPLFLWAGLRTLFGALFGVGGTIDGIGGAVFTMAGGGLLALAVTIRNQTQERFDLRSREPTRPWLWRKDWASSRVVSDDGTGLRILWVFTILWNLMSLPVLLGAAKHAIFFAWMFPAVGAGLLIWVIRATLRARRYGTAVLILDTLPGVIGGTLAGTVHVPAALEPRSGARVRLNCSVGSGDHSKETWEEEHPIESEGVLTGSAGAVFPFSVTIPYGLPSSNPETQNVSWRLDLMAEASGIDFRTSFEVPIFETPDSSPEIDARVASPPPASPAEVVSEQPEHIDDASRIRAARVDGGIDLYFPALRNPGSALAVTGAFFFWCFIALMMGVGAELHWLIFVPLLVLPGLLLLWAVFDTWLASVRLRVQEGCLQRRIRFLGAGYSQTFQAEAVEDFEIVFRARMGKTALYDLRVKRHDRFARTLVRGIRGKRLAERIQDWIRRAFAGEAL